MRDFAAAAGLFLATASVVLWQNAHVAVLWDASYTLDSATRIAMGQMPYRDFPFVHAPFTFLIQAAIIRFTGRVFFHHILYSAVMGGLGTVLAWRIVLWELRLRVQSAWALALLLATPLTFLGIYSILPFPSYDCDCALAILVAVWCLQRLDTASASSLRARWRGFATGCALCLPVFVKQNMGLPFLLAAVGSVVLLLFAGLLRREKSGFDQVPSPTLFAALAGSVTTILAALLVLHFTAGVGNYVYWTMQFAGQRRLPGLPAMAAIYSDPRLRWTLPTAAVALILLAWRRSRPTSILAGRLFPIAAFLLLSAPFLLALSAFWLYYDDPDFLRDTLMTLWPFLMFLARSARHPQPHSLSQSHVELSFLPLILLVAIHGHDAFAAALGLHLRNLAASCHLDCRSACLHSRPAIAPNGASMVSSFTGRHSLLCASGFAALFTRSAKSGFRTSTFPTAPWSTQPSRNLPAHQHPGRICRNSTNSCATPPLTFRQNDGIILLPGEDPFYFATGRTPQFSVLLFDRSTDPYSPGRNSRARQRAQHSLAG